MFVVQKKKRNVQFCLHTKEFHNSCRISILTVLFMTCSKRTQTLYCAGAERCVYLSHVKIKSTTTIVLSTKKKT